MAIAHGIAQPTSADAIRKFVATWNAEASDVAPESVALALRAASTMDEYHRNAQSIEIVWTGPSFQGCTLRRTDQVLLDLIQSAERSLMIITFAAYDIPHVARALQDAAGRNVDIIMILESSESSAGKLSFNALDALGAAVSKTARVYVWPLEKREKDEAGHHGCLHAKCAIADGKSALISSANLTGHTLNLNMELGLLIRGGDVPSSIADHFRRIIKSGALELARRNST